VRAHNVDRIGRDAEKADWPIISTPARRTCTIATAASSIGASATGPRRSGITAMAGRSRAWRACCSTCPRTTRTVRASSPSSGRWRGRSPPSRGMLGSVQAPNDRPGATSPGDTEIYATGAFLLAGGEVHRLAASMGR